MALYTTLIACLLFVDACLSVNSIVKIDDAELAPKKFDTVSPVMKKAKLKANNFLQRLLQTNLSESTLESNPQAAKPSTIKTKSDSVQNKKDISPTVINTNVESETQAPDASRQRDAEFKSKGSGLKKVSPSTDNSTTNPVSKVEGSSNITSATTVKNNRVNTLTANGGKKLETDIPVKNLSSPISTLQKGGSAEQGKWDYVDREELTPAVTPEIKQINKVINKMKATTPAVKLIDPDDNTAEDDLFLEDNISSSSKDTDKQTDQDQYEHEEDNWYQDANILETDSKETPEEDEDEWNFWNDHHGIVIDQNENVADKFGDFWDEQSYARGPYLKEAIVTSSVKDHKESVRREVNLMTFYSWVLFISLSLLALYVFYRQKNVFKPYWSYLYQSSPVKRRLSTEDSAEERKGLVHHAYA